MKSHIQKLLDKKKEGTPSDLRWVDPPTTLSESAAEAWEACAGETHCDGIVYFIEVGGFVKIGYTEGNVYKRMSELETGSPFDYKVLTLVSGSLRLERKLHAIFHDHLHRREWFRLDGQLKEFIEAAKGVRLRRPNRAKEALLAEQEAERFERLSLLSAVSGGGQ